MEVRGSPFQSMMVLLKNEFAWGVCPGPVDLKLDVSSLSTVWFGCDIHVISLIWV